MTRFFIGSHTGLAVLLGLTLVFAQTCLSHDAYAQGVPVAPAVFPAVPPSRPTPQTSFPPSNYGAGHYAVSGQTAVQTTTQPTTQMPAGPGGSHNGVAPLPPLKPPTDYERGAELVSPLPDQTIQRLRVRFDSSRQAKSYRPVRTSPRIRSTSVDLAPGAALPILRTMPGETSTVVFLDSTGAPWPLAAIPRVSRPDVASAEWLKDTPAVVVSMLSPYEEANLTVFLHGLPMPVVVKLAAGEPSGAAQTRQVDYRLDLRVPGRGPNAKPAIAGSGQIALYDDTLQGFLDGLPPHKAVRLKAHSAVPGRTEIWQYEGALFVRTNRDIQTAFESTLAASDGTRVYRLALTPFVTLSDAGRAVTVQIDLQ
jgi:intracellular multiplication protein IcmK